MSGSDQLTTAYLSKESSIKTLSATLVDAARNGAQTPGNADAGLHTSHNGNNTHNNRDHSTEELYLLSRATTAGPTTLEIDGTSVEEDFFESIAPATRGATDGPLRAVPVVDRQDLSMEDISLMRLEGCRTHRRTPNTSFQESFCEEILSTAALPGAAPYRFSNVSSHHVDGQDGLMDNVSVTSLSYGRSMQLRSHATSPGTVALDTSVAILQHMATDTAAQMEAARSGQTPADFSSVAASSNTSSPQNLLTRQRTVVPMVPAVEKVIKEDTTDPFGLIRNGDSDHPTSQLHNDTTNPYLRSSSSGNSPLHSLSESELCGAQVRPLGASRSTSAQGLGQLAADHTDTTAAAAVAGAGAAGAFSTPAPCFGGSSDGTRGRLRLVGVSAQAHGDERSGFEAVEPQSTPPAYQGRAPASPVADTTVYNHDFQRIISHEVKEALTRNMRPSIDDDDDEDEALLNDVLSGQLSPALLPMQERGSFHMNESRNCTFAPFQLPMGATSISRLDSVFDTPGGKPGTCGANGFSGRAAVRRPLSLSTAAFDGETAAGNRAFTQSSNNANGSGGAAFSTTATRSGTKAQNPRTVSAQAWRFPTLGRDPATFNGAARRASLEDNTDGDAEGGDAMATVATTATVGGAAMSSSRRTRRTALPNSCHSSSDRLPGQMTPLSGSWRQRRGSDASTAVTAAAANGCPWSTSGRSASISAAAATTFSCGGGGVRGAGVSQKLSAGAEGSEVHHGRSLSGATAASAVRYEDGRLYAQPIVSTHSSSSLAGSGGVSDDNYPRKLEMVYTVYERLTQERRSGHTPAAVKKLVARRESAGSVSENLPTAPQAGQLAQRSNPGHAAATDTALGSGLSSRERRSPSLSCSGALGRSAGYYSFGTRLSLSHPNRQALPQQYLGSCSNLMYYAPSPCTAVLGSPAVMDFVVGGVSSNHANSGNRNHTTGARNTSIITGLIGINHNAPENSLVNATSSATRTARRSLNSALVCCIESRPLLQSTLFLKHTLRLIRESHSCGSNDAKTRPSDTPRSTKTTSQPAPSGATEVPSGPHDVSYYTDMSTKNDMVAHFSGNDYLASVATAPGSVANVALEDAEQSSGHTRSLPSGSSRSSAVDKAVANRKGGASAAADAAAAVTAAPQNVVLMAAAVLGTGQQGRQTHMDPNTDNNSVAAAYEAEEEDAAASRSPSPQERPDTATQAYTPHKFDEVGGGGDMQQMQQQQRYHRALTEAEQRVRHVHGVDGIEREVDNESLDLIVYVGMRLMGWLEVVSLLGCGSFGQVFLCKDLRICDGHFVHPSEVGGVDYEYWNCSHAFLPFSSVDIPPTNPPLVAVKVVKSVPLLEQQSVLEAEMLVLIGAQTAAPASASDSGNAPPPEDPRCVSVAKVLADGICYGHHCIVMERYGANLYEYIASNEHLGLPMYQIRSIGQQLFTALSLIHEACHIIHADIKPENMLLTLNSSRGVVRTNEAVTTATTTTPTDAQQQQRPSSNGNPLQHVPRMGDSVTAMSTMCSPERSYITLRTGPTAAGRHRHGQSLSRRSSAVPLDSSTSTMNKAKGQSFCHLRSSVTSRLTVVEQSSVPAPEPRRVQSLNQSAGMLPSRNVSTAHLDAASAAALTTTTPAISGGRSGTAPTASSIIPRLHVKLIDFSSSCYDGGPFYQYIQSRYYRAPEVIVGATYGSGIDIWSSGCLLAELLLGMPLLPGCNDHHQLCLIEEMVGPLPVSMVQEGVNAELYYRHLSPEEEEAQDPSQAIVAGGAAPSPPPRPYALRSREEFLEITQSDPQPYRRYFTYQTLQELVRHCPLTLEERRMSNGLQPYVPANESSEIPPNITPSPSVRSEMMKQRFLLFDLLRRLLQTDPKQRPTASQVLTHPFFTSAPPYMKTFMLD